MVESGRLTEVWPGVVALESTTATRLVGAIRYSGEGAVLSHVTAAQERQWGDWSRRHPEVHVCVPHGAKPRPLPGLVVHQRVSLDRDWAGSLPLTPATETLVGCAAVLAVPDLRAAATAAIRRGIVQVGELTSAAVPKRHRSRWRQLIEELEAGAWSGPEAGYWRLLKDAGLPLPELNARVDTLEGPRYVDALWRELRFGAEIDGRSVHAQELAFESDRYRQNLLTVEGLALIRFPAADIDQRPDAVLRTTSQALRSRATELGRTDVLMIGPVTKRPRGGSPPNRRS